MPAKRGNQVTPTLSKVDYRISMDEEQNDDDEQLDDGDKEHLYIISLIKENRERDVSKALEASRKSMGRVAKEEDGRGLNVLHWAVRRNMKRVFQKLVLKFGLDLHKTDSLGRNILHFAVATGDVSLIQTVVETIDALVESNGQVMFMRTESSPSLLQQERYAFDAEAALPPSSLLEDLINTPDARGQYPLSLALKNNSHQIAEALIRRGSSLKPLEHVRDPNFIHRAITEQQKGVLEAVFNRPKAEWEHLLKEVHEGSTPMRRLIEAMPDVAELILDQCVIRTLAADNVVDLSIDPKTTRSKGSVPKVRYAFDYTLIDEREITSQESTEPFSVRNYIQKVRFRWKRPIAQLIRSKSSRKALLLHPLTLHYIFLQPWFTMFNVYLYFYYFGFYLCFALVLSWELVTKYSHLKSCDYAWEMENGTRTLVETIDIEEWTRCAILLESAHCSHWCENQTANGTESVGAMPPNLDDADIYGSPLTYVVLFLAYFQLVSSLLSVAFDLIVGENVVSRLLFLTDLQCYIEMLTVFSIVYAMRDLIPCDYWFFCGDQVYVGAVSGVGVWILLICKAQNIPILGVYSRLLLSISFGYALRFLVMFMIVLAPFAVSFFMLLRGQMLFRSFHMAALKTLTTMTGEFEMSTLVGSADSTGWFYTVFFLFLAFIFVSSLGAVTLFTAMAVEDFDWREKKAFLDMIEDVLTNKLKFAALFGDGNIWAVDSDITLPMKDFTECLGHKSGKIDDNEKEFIRHWILMKRQVRVSRMTFPSIKINKLFVNPLCDIEHLDEIRSGDTLKQMRTQEILSVMMKKLEKMEKEIRFSSQNRRSNTKKGSPDALS